MFLPSHINVGLVTHHHFRQPVQVLVTVMNAGMEEQSVPTVGWRYPCHQWHEQHLLAGLRQPHSQGVLFVSHKPIALPGFARAFSLARAIGRVGLDLLFLKPLVAAGRSVESINPTDLRSTGRASKSGSNRCRLIWRKIPTLSRERNSCRLEAAGSFRRLGRPAKRLQERCSGKSSTTRLKECAGVSRASRVMRKSCAELHDERRPAPR